MMIRYAASGLLRIPLFTFSSILKPTTPEQKKTMDKPWINHRGPKKVKLEVGEKSYFYCACGLSNSQPFCDGSHQGTPFTPLKFTAQKETNFICQCKQTKTAPYCDGTHNTIK